MNGILGYTREYLNITLMDIMECQDDETIFSENGANAFMQLNDDPTIDIIHDACKNLNCLHLGNVCKYLINQTITRVQGNPERYYLYLQLWLGRARNQFQKICQVCEILKKECRKKGKGALRKDYVEVVKKFGERFVFHLVFNLILREIVKDLKEGKKGRIKEHNLEMYINAIEAIYIYSCNKLHIVPIV